MKVLVYAGVVVGLRVYKHETKCSLLFAQHYWYYFYQILTANICS